MRPSTKRSPSTPPRWPHRHLGISPEDALPVTASIPDPANLDPKADHAQAALDYMGLTPGRPFLDGRDT